MGYRGAQPESGTAAANDTISPYRPLCHNIAENQLPVADAILRAASCTMHPPFPLSPPPRPIGQVLSQSHTLFPVQEEVLLTHKYHVLMVLLLDRINHATDPVVVD